MRLTVPERDGLQVVVMAMQQAEEDGGKKWRNGVL